VPTTPTQRSLQYCRKNGLSAGVVERWIPRVNKRSDLFGCIDLIVVAGKRIVGVQATSGTNHASREAKIRGLMAEDSENGRALRALLAAGGHVEVWSWEKKGARGARKLWALRVTEVTNKEERP
jgi:hypothetical protein